MVVMAATDDIQALLNQLWPYAAVVAGFGAFIVWNGGIVVGDRTNHTAGLHLPQLGYFVAFSLALSAPVIITSLTDDALRMSRRSRPGALSTNGQRLGMLLAWLAVFTLFYTACIAGFTVQHKYLLSGMPVAA